MVEVYKIFSGKYVTVANWLTDRYLERHYDLRGHRFSLYQSQIRYDTRKYNFTNRIISIWNGLPDTVISATTVDTFKARLDRFWQNQEVIVRYGNSLRICVLCCDLVADRTSLLIDSFEICRLALSADVTDVNFRRLSAAHGFVGTTVHWKREMFEFIDPLSFRRSKSMTIWP